MPKTKYQVVIIDYNEYYYTQDLKLTSNPKKGSFPQITSVKSLNDLDRQEGLILIMTVSDIIDFYTSIDIYNPDVYELDRKFRLKFRHFNYVIIISQEEFNYGKIPFSNIYVVYANNYFNSEGLNPLINQLYQEYLNLKEIKLTKTRLDHVKALKNYLIKSRQVFFSTSQLTTKLNMSPKMLQRTIKDLNYLYHNIGYDKKKRLWYYIKSNHKNK